jgi:hypothetical protein
LGVENPQKRDRLFDFDGHDGMPCRDLPVRRGGAQDYTAARFTGQATRRGWP